VLRTAREGLGTWLRLEGARRRGLRVAARLIPRWAAGLGAVLLVALAVGLAVVGVPAQISGAGDVFANLGRNLLTAAVLAVIAWLWLYSWTSARATRRLREDARRRPQDLFAIPPRVRSAGRVVGRDQVVADLATNLSSDYRTGPQVLVGETGAGKTSVLLKLAHHFAERDVLPIVLSLRGVEDVDFGELAKVRFREYIDPHLRNEAEADKLWRWMSRRGKIVVLADDLDRARLPGQATDPYKLSARLALEVARRRDLPLVVASRHQGVPPDLPERPVELGPLDWGDPRKGVARAVEMVLDRAGRRDEDGPARPVQENIVAGAVLDNAFYLEVITQLVRVDALRELHELRDEGEHAVRVALLDDWRQTIVGDRTVPDAARERRGALLAALEGFAADRLVPPPQREEAGVVKTAAEDHRWADALRFGEAARLVEVEDDGSYRFSHDVVHAYFAARALPYDDEARRRALQIAPDAPRVQLALVLAAAGSQDPEFCRAVCESLLDARGDTTDEQRLLRASSAAEIARAGGFTALDGRIVKECIAARGDASLVAKRAALGQLAFLRGDVAVLALWDYAGDSDYGVRWMAARRLVERPDAYAVLAPLVESQLESARKCLAAEERADDWHEAILPLKHMAWMLPSLRTRARAAGDEALAKRIEGDLAELLRLEAEGVTRQKGLEASIAQGFKADALMHPGSGVDPDARRLLARSGTFWYSQLNLLHAIVVRTRDGTEARGLIEPLTNRDRHPFVRAAAKMCANALGGPDVMDYVWHDESVLVCRRPAGLAPAAIQLVGDITALLNLNETGSAEQREAFGTADELPYCFAGSRSRTELFDERRGCNPACPFRLCPYSPAIDRMSSHREISRAFCRHQRLYAKPASARRWGSRVRRGALRDFWRELESLARV
jgi:hypothetical protein